MNTFIFLFIHILYCICICVPIHWLSKDIFYFFSSFIRSRVMDVNVIVHMPIGSKMCLTSSNVLSQDFLFNNLLFYVLISAKIVAKMS